VNKKEPILSRAARQAKQIAEPVTRHPLVELTGERRVLIENHIGVTEYGLSEICIAVRYGHIRIQGRCMRLEHMTKDRLLITGHIDNICLCRRCGKE